MEPPTKKSKFAQLPKFSNNFYPPISDNRTIISKYINREDLKPINILHKRLVETEERRNEINYGEKIAHLFMRDFRIIDNKGLSLASKLASDKNLPLITIYVFCIEDIFSHAVSHFQLEFRLRSLEILKQELYSLNIPIILLEVEKSEEVPNKLLEFLTQNKVSHIFSNIEYEVDELRLFSSLLSHLSNENICFKPVHDSCIVCPGELYTKSKGTQYTVFAPWYKAWCKYVKSTKECLSVFPKPSSNKSNFPSDFKDLFESELPQAPEDKKLTRSQEKIFNSYWKCGEKEAWNSLYDFLQSDKFIKYDDSRNDISMDVVSCMSCYISSGIISTRSIVRYLLDHKLIRQIDSGDKGTGWIRQIAWRDFYKHILCNWPYICMFKPFLLEYDELKWEYNYDHFKSWCEGKTGFPIVDAAMRQLNETGYLHNRCRMIVASFLTKHLLIDWRYGEYYFMEHLVDGDFASNNGGWGFCSSIGVDPQPYFRIFNPWLQSEKFDKKGNYIRKWVMELRDIEDEKGIHNPYENGFERIAMENGYPRPIVDHKTCRERALARFKQAKY